MVLPKSVTASRIEENLKTVKLDSSDLEALEAIHKKKGITRFVYPAFGVSTNEIHQVGIILTSPGQTRLSGQGLSALTIS